MCALQIEELAQRLQSLYDNLDRDGNGDPCCFAQEETVKSIVDQFQDMFTESRRDAKQQLHDLQYSTLRLVGRVGQVVRNAHASASHQLL